MVKYPPTMVQQNPAQIFKAQTRGYAENEKHRLQATFSFNEFNAGSKNAFGSLTALNDETLAPKKGIERQIAPGTLVMILPLVGAAECDFSDSQPQIVVPGEAFTFHSHEGSVIRVSNPYEESIINFIYITFSNPGPSDILLPKGFLIAQTNLAEKNVFHKLFEVIQSGFSVQLALFTGRAEKDYFMSNKANGVFAFVISGAFEIKGRLLEERDGLALWDTKDVDIEALSENAILLLIEVPLNGFTAD